MVLLLREAFEKHGLPNEIISDNSRQFRAIHGGPATRYARLLGTLGVRVLYHAPDHPQTKGKLERWFGTVMSWFMPEAQHLVGTRPGLTLAQLNQKFAEWLEWYNSRHPHASLGRQPPARVFQEHTRRVFRPLAVVVNWDAWVETLEDRKVFKNNRICVDCKSYTLPPGFASTRVQVRKLEDRYEVCSSGALVETFFKSPGDGASDCFLERVISKNGTFKFRRKTYYVGYYQKIFIPIQVFEEVVVAGKKLGKTDAFLIEERINEKKIVTQKIIDITTREKLVTDFNIHLGEAEALVLYFEISGELLGTDEGKMIDLCKIFRIPFFSCLSFILFAVEKKILPQGQGIAKLQALRKYGWYTLSLLDEIELKLHTMGV